MHYCFYAIIITNISKEKEVNARIKFEKAREKKEAEFEIIGVYDYDLDDLNKINNQLTRAFLQMRTIASCVITFGHQMRAEFKKDLIFTLYKMPNQIFYKWAAEYDEQLGKVLLEIANDTYVNELTAEVADEIFQEIQNVSISLLTNMYYCIANNAVTSSNIQTLTREEYISTNNHKLQQLMFLEQTNNCNDFILKATDLFENTDNVFVQKIVKIMVKHLLTWSPTLTTDKHHQLLNTFGLESERKTILLARNNKR